MGCCKGPATFLLMNQTMTDSSREICLAYLDDDIVFYTDLEVASLPTVTGVSLTTMGQPEAEPNTVNPRTVCSYGLGSLGISKPNSRFILATSNVPLPCIQCNVKSFLELVGYRRRFVQRLSQSPLCSMLSNPKTPSVARRQSITPSSVTLQHALTSLSAVVFLGILLPLHTCLCLQIRDHHNPVTGRVGVNHPLHQFVDQCL